jgi:hypothetical protein
MDPSARTIDHPTLVAAVAGELDQRAGVCRPEHWEVGEAVAGRLGLAVALDPLDALGTGIFVRRAQDWPIELLSMFRWACVAVRTPNGRLNRDAAWWSEARAAGVVLTAMDWLPEPGGWQPKLLADDIDWTAQQGSVCWVSDAETPGPPRGWNGQLTQTRRYIAEARAACDRAGVALGFTGIAMLPATATWRAWVAGCSDLLIPQPYDRYGAYEVAYPRRVLDRWIELGADAGRIVIGRGAFVDPDGPGPLAARWRTAAEIARHRATTPTGYPLVGEAWWPPAGRMPAAVLAAIHPIVGP